MRIGLSGKMCSGKSLVAEYLTKTYGFTEYSFARRLKELAKELFGIVNKDEQGRNTMQRLAEHLRSIDPYVWVRYTVEHMDMDGDLVISDVRYPNEYETLKKLGFMIVRMEQDPKEQLRLLNLNYPGLPERLLYHYSEVALDKHTFDYTIHNGTEETLDDVFTQVEALLDALRPRAEKLEEEISTDEIIKSLPPGTVRPDLLPTTKVKRPVGRPPKHGAYSKFNLIPLEEAKIQEITEIIQGEKASIGKSDMLYIRLLGRLLAQIEILDRYFQQHGVFQDTGKGLTWPVFTQYLNFVKQASAMLDKMGMTASGRVRLGSQLLQADIAMQIQDSRGEEE